MYIALSKFAWTPQESTSFGVTGNILTKDGNRPANMESAKTICDSDIPIFRFDISIPIFFAVRRDGLTEYQND